jgi:hypothetical protein
MGMCLGVTGTAGRDHPSLAAPGRAGGHVSDSPRRTGHHGNARVGGLAPRLRYAAYTGISGTTVAAISLDPRCKWKAVKDVFPRSNWFVRSGILRVVTQASEPVKLLEIGSQLGRRYELGTGCDEQSSTCRFSSSAKALVRQDRRERLARSVVEDLERRRRVVLDHRCCCRPKVGTRLRNKGVGQFAARRDGLKLSTGDHLVNDSPSLRPGHQEAALSSSASRVRGLALTVAMNGSARRFQVSTLTLVTLTDCPSCSSASSTAALSSRRDASPTAMTSMSRGSGPEAPSRRAAHDP